MKNLFVFLIAVASVLGACKKKSNEGEKCQAGKGGQLSVMAYLNHHGHLIHSQADYPDTVYVKYNTQDAPAGNNTALYDAYFVGASGDDHVHIAGLRCGNYYFFAAGRDTTDNSRVTGGIPFSTENKSGELTIHIPVH